MLNSRKIKKYQIVYQILYIQRVHIIYIYILHLLKNITEQLIIWVPGVQKVKALWHPRADRQRESGLSCLRLACGCGWAADLIEKYSEFVETIPSGNLT